jgi:hypothetical protein
MLLSLAQSPVANKIFVKKVRTSAKATILRAVELGQVCIQA